MFGAQATLLLALAAVTAAVLGRSPSSGDPLSGDPLSADPRATGPSRACVGSQALRGFLVVGVGALVVLAVAVVGVGVLDRPDRAAGLAVVSLFGYLLYLTVAVLLCRWTARRR